VKSLAHPGGNITGFHNYEPALGGKWLEVLKEVAPSARRVAVVHVPEIAANVAFIRAAEASSKALGVTVMGAGVRDAADIESVLSDFAREPNGGHLAWRESRQFTSTIANQKSINNQSQDREGSRLEAVGIIPTACRRGDRMRRRDFITLTGGSAAAWPLVASAQSPAQEPRRIAAMHNIQSENSEAFVQGLREAGYQYKNRSGDRP
jgi:hypothetical protein